MNRFTDRTVPVTAWLRYFFKARHHKGHDVHSPFVSDFITKVLNDRKKYRAYEIAEAYRKFLEGNRTLIRVRDFGAGSRTIRPQNSSVAVIAKHASVNRKSGQLLYRLAHFYKPDLVIELGTSLGVSTHYLALGNPFAKVITVEADPALAELALKGLKDHQIDNVHLINDTFDNALPALLTESPGKMLVFIDGNHCQSATLRYAGFFLPKVPDGSMLVFDDINWSKGMRQAWKEIRRDSNCTLALDLFNMGIVFKKHDFFMEKYTIRF